MARALMHKGYAVPHMCERNSVAECACITKGQWSHPQGGVRSLLFWVLVIKSILLILYKKLWGVDEVVIDCLILL